MRTLRKLLYTFVVLTIGPRLFLNLPVRAQDGKTQPVHLEGVRLNGLHTFVTDNWVTAELTIANSNTVGRDCRVVVFYASQPDVQYARDVWVPEKSSLSTWVSIGPAPREERSGSGNQKISEKRPSRSQELQALIYDRTGNRDRLVLPKSEERVRSRPVPYQPREPVTCLLMDEKKPKDPIPNRYPVDPPEPEDIVDLVWAFRAGAGLSAHVRLIDDSILPLPEAGFDGVDHFVVAGRRLADDPPGQVALSRWLEQGGRLWVMLDQADEHIIGQILGDAPGFHVVDRTSLTRIAIESVSVRDIEREVHEFERPIDFVRAEVGPEYTVLHRVNGWPASFTRVVGKGRLLVTTVGARAWFRERTEDDPQSPFESIHDLPVILPPMDLLSRYLQPPESSLQSGGWGTKDWEQFSSLVNEDIGYRVVGLGTAGMIFAGFLSIVLVLGISLRRWRRSELVGWLGPVAALITGGAFMGLGELSRRAVPPTVAVAQTVTVSPEASEQSVMGVLGLLQPDGGPVNLRSNSGGILDLDMSGLQGQTRRLVVTDIDAWHWEELALPAGVRLGPFRSVFRSGEPMAIVAWFGPEGLEGKLSAGPFHGLADGVIQAPSLRGFSVRLRPDRGFTVGADDLLPPGQYLAETVLSDRQQRRQAIYQRILAAPSSGLAWEKGRDESRFLVWAEPIQVPFTFDAGHHWSGSALLTFPCQLEHSPPGKPVTVPRGFTSYRRILDTGPTNPTLDGTTGIDQRLRFQLPASVLPLKIERARLFAKVDAPLRRITVSGRSKDGRVQIRTLESPVDPLQIDIVPSDLLVLDDQGGLHLDIEVGDAPPTEDGQTLKWAIQSLELEITGEALERK